MADLSGRVVAITGASSGIGEALARQLAALGALVVVSARRQDRLDALVTRINEAGGRAVAIVADVTSESDMQALVDGAISHYGRIDVMIANAGIGYHGSLEESSTGAMRRVVDVNLLGTFYAAHAAVVPMRRQGHGHIIAVSSIVGRRGVGGSSVYSATKAGQVAFVEALRAEFVGTALHASVVLPVASSTGFHEAIARDFGHSVGGRGPRQSADDVARSIVRCILKPRAEVYPYPRAWWLALLNVLAPAQTDRIVRRFGRHRHPEVDHGQPRN